MRQLFCRLLLIIVTGSMILSNYNSPISEEYAESADNSDIPGSAAAGRAAYEVVLVGAVEPRASSTDMNGSVRNPLEVGEEINFRVVVENSGDNYVSELSITVVVDDGVEVTPLIIDAEDSAVCDDAQYCPHESLAAGDYLAGGNYYVRDGAGGNLAWTPDAPGVFTVTIAIDALGQDTNLNNNQISYDITVIDWYDISVALAWDDEVNGGAGAGPHAFTMTALVDGSDSWEPRGVELEVHFGGLFSAFDAQSNPVSTFDADGEADGNKAQDGCPDINDCTWTINFGDLRGAGQATDIEVYANLTSEPPSFTNASDLGETRRVPAFQTAYTFDGVIKGDGATADGVGAFTVTASLKDYVIFEQVSTDFGAGPGAHESDIVTEMVETNQSLDDRNGNNDALLTGTFASYHDVSVTAITVGISERSQGGRLDAGDSALYATISHSGSDQAVEYDWQVWFDIRDLSNDQVTTTPFVLDCDLANDLGSQQVHRNLGFSSPALSILTVCTPLLLNPGTYAITAHITLIDATLTDTNGPNGTNDESDDCGTNPPGPGINPDCHVDAISVNSEHTGYYEVVNYGPFAYLSMDEVSAALVMGDNVSFFAHAMHLNQPDFDGDGNADPMNYTWTAIGAFPQLPSELTGDCLEQDVCTIELDAFWLGSPIIFVTVTDYWGMSAVAHVQLTVGIQYSSTDNAGDCYDIDYSIVFQGSLPMAANFSDADDAVGQSLPGSNATWDYVCTFDMEVLAVLSPSDVYSEDLTVRIDADPAEGYSLWWYEGGTGWVELAGTTQSQVDADTVSLAWTNDGSLGSRNSSTYAVFTYVTLAQPPQVGISGLSATLSAGGLITLIWNIENIVLVSSSDFGAIYINDAGDALDGTRNTFPLSTTAWQITGTHGTTYNYLVRVENGEVDDEGSSLFGTPVDSGSATADGQVDPSADASAIDANKNVDHITFSWTAADISDIDHWVICWSQGSSHTGLEVTTNLIGTSSCYNTVDSTPSATMAHHMSTGDYFYSVNAVDSIGNVESADSSDTLEFTTGTTGGSNNTNGQSDTDGDGVPDDEDFKPNDSTQWVDSDGDGYGDNPLGTKGDDCPSEFGNSIWLNRLGCPDLDGDGYADSQDNCPTEFGTTTQHGLIGCPDDDNDGWANSIDVFPMNNTEWIDADEDGVGDNADECSNTPDGVTVDGHGCAVESGVSMAVKVGVGVGGTLAGASLLFFFLPRMMRRMSMTEELANEQFHDELWGEVSKPSGPPSDDLEAVAAPAANLQGDMQPDGFEYIEWPPDSEGWWVREHSGLPWKKWVK